MAEILQGVDTGVSRRALERVTFTIIRSLRTSILSHPIDEKTVKRRPIGLVASVERHTAERTCDGKLASVAIDVYPLFGKQAADNIHTPQGGTIAYSTRNLIVSYAGYRLEIDGHNNMVEEDEKGINGEHRTRMSTLSKDKLKAHHDKLAEIAQLFNIHH